MSDDPRRNPSLVLGLDFGASREEARRAFARRIRAVRRDGGRYTTEDLTWALHTVEHATDDAHSSVEWYRVPANRTLLAAPPDGLLFNPPAPVLARRTAPPSEADLEAIAQRALDEALAALLSTATAPANRNPYSQR